MKRRDFLEGLGVTVTMVSTGAILTACGSDGPDTGPNDGGACTAGDASASSSGSHSEAHTISLTMAQIEAGADVTVTSTSVSGHVHLVDVTAAQLGTLASNCVVDVSSSDLHPHTWRIQIA